MKVLQEPISAMNLKCVMYMQKKSAEAALQNIIVVVGAPLILISFTVP